MRTALVGLVVLAVGVLIIVSSPSADILKAEGDESATSTPSNQAFQGMPTVTPTPTPFSPVVQAIATPTSTSTPTIEQSDDDVEPKSCWIDGAPCLCWDNPTAG